VIEDFYVIVPEQVERERDKLFFSKDIICEYSIGYEDEICLTEINECLSNPCRNNASCIDQINGYLCTCPKSFIGPQCENKVKLDRSFSFCYFIISFS
jgi:hypothetical protein